MVAFALVAIDLNQTKWTPKTYLQGFLRFSSQSRKSGIVFLRPGIFGSAGATPEIYINQQHTLSLNNQSWHGSAGPGEYQIVTRQGEDWRAGEPGQLTLSVKKGNRYFMRVLAGTTFKAKNFFLSLLVPGSALFIGSVFPLIVVEQEEAIKELLEINVTRLIVNRHLSF